MPSLFGKSVELREESPRQRGGPDLGTLQLLYKLFRHGDVCSVRGGSRGEVLCKTAREGFEVWMRAAGDVELREPFVQRRMDGGGE